LGGSGVIVISVYFKGEIAGLLRKSDPCATVPRSGRNGQASLPVRGAATPRIFARQSPVEFRGNAHYQQNYSVHAANPQ
jgi:hypothetical protein